MNIYVTQLVIKETNTSVNNMLEKADYLFVGSGASATLLLMSMEKKGLLHNKKIIVIDPDYKIKNDKTYCFWTDSIEKKQLLCSQLISNEWRSFRKQDGTIEQLLSLRYCLVNSFDLYTEMKRLITQYNIERLHDSVNELTESTNGVQVITSSQTHHATIVFDSRPPHFMAPSSNEAHLHQSFLGYFITCENKNRDYQAVDLMDFNVDQAGETQFFYVLPFDENKLLVELTRFGKKVIDEENASLLLDAYITKRFGNYTITATERGNIPMSTAAITTQRQTSVVLIGARSGAIKPSTGYAFKNMMRQAEDISAALVAEKKPSNTKKSSRFQLYDRLLLQLLVNKPHLGKKIFSQLFAANNFTAVFNFLDEKTTFSAEIKIFKSLPIIPFLGAFLKDALVSKKKILASLLLLLVTFSMLLIQQYDGTLFSWTNNTLLLGGLALVGIPHGAVDHLLTADNKLTRPTFGFVIRYLGVAVVLFLLWLVTPTLSLLLFLIYSSWHFGESDFFQWKINAKNRGHFFLWGSVLLVYLLVSHYNETVIIVANLSVYIPKLSPEQLSVTCGSLILLGVLLAIINRNMLLLTSLMMLVLASHLPLLTAFGLYFIGQHSVNSWIHIKNGLAFSNKKLFTTAFPFTLGAFLLFGIVFYLVKNEIISIENNNLIGLLFIFISCISLPHILVIHGFYKRIIMKKEINKQ